MGMNQWTSGHMAARLPKYPYDIHLLAWRHTIGQSMDHGACMAPKTARAHTRDKPWEFSRVPYVYILRSAAK